MGWTPDPRPIGGGDGGGPPIPGKSGVVVGARVDPRSPANRGCQWDPHRDPPAIPGKSGMGMGMGIGGSVPWCPWLL